MKVIQPIAITDTQFVSSTAPETEYAAYAPGTSYALNAKCIWQHQVYQCVQGPSTGNQPDLSPLYWAPASPTNRWAMFDASISTQTTLASPLTVVIKPGYVNSLALFGLVGSSVTVTVTDGLGGPVVYSATRSLDGTIIADFYQYFFEPSVQLAEIVLTNLPPYSNAYITVTITGGGSVACGSLIAGTFYALGDTQMGATAGIIDYSRKDTSATGITTLTKRAYSKRMSAQIWLDNGQLNKIQRVLADLRATPCVWIGTDIAGYAPLIVFGFYRDFSIDISYPTVSVCSLEIEGMT